MKKMNLTNRQYQFTSWSNIFDIFCWS